MNNQEELEALTIVTPIIISYIFNLLLQYIFERIVARTIKYSLTLLLVH